MVLVPSLRKANGRRPCATCRLVAPAESGAAAKLDVPSVMFRAITVSVVFDHTWQPSTKAMLLVSCEASAKSPRRSLKLTRFRGHDEA
jgi:hypothetical protein